MANLQEILLSRKIDRVIYVDDELGKQSFFDNLKGCFHLMISQGREEDTPSFISEKEIWEEQFLTWWGQSSFDDVTSLASKYGVLRSNPNIVNNVIGIIPEGVSLELLAPEQFNEDYRKRLIQDLESKNKYSIILVDYDLEGYPENGDKMLATISSCPNCFCGVFSQTFEPQDEIAKWKERAFNRTVYPLSKNRFYSDPANGSIIQGIKNVIWLKQIEIIKDLAKTTITNAISELDNKFREIDPATFDRIVISSSRSEGCWEFEYLFRIAQIYLRQGAREGFKKSFNDFKGITNSLREFSDGSQNEFVNNNLIDSLSEEEYFDDIKFVNDVYSPIANGDIFQVSDKFYILVGQPCSLSIRQDGKRAHQLDQAFLLPLVEDGKGGNNGMLHKPFNKVLSFAAFASRQRASLSILDLVSFNAEGSALIDMGKSSNQLSDHEVMQENMLLRYEMIRDKINSYRKAYSYIEYANTKEDKNAFARFFCKAFEMGDAQIAKKPEIEGDRILFKIKRVGRYSDYGAHILLQQFMGFLSRPDFPGDFVRE